MKTYVFDIDGTICSKTSGGEYNDCVPYVERINRVNRLYEDGNIIIYFTARGMGRYNNNSELAINRFYHHTESQLKSWGAKFNQLILGKPAADFYIDDKGISDEKFFTD